MSMENKPIKHLILITFSLPLKSAVFQLNSDRRQRLEWGVKRLKLHAPEVSQL